MELHRHAEEFLEFIRLIHSDRRFGAYTKDIEKFFRLFRPYMGLEPDSWPSVVIDWEKLRSHCEYFLVKLHFDRRPLARQLTIPEALTILAQLKYDEPFRRSLVWDIASLIAAFLNESTPDTLSPPARPGLDE